MPPIRVIFSPFSPLPVCISDMTCAVKMHANHPNLSLYLSLVCLLQIWFGVRFSGGVWSGMAAQLHQREDKESGCSAAVCFRGEMLSVSHLLHVRWALAEMPGIAWYHIIICSCTVCLMFQGFLLAWKCFWRTKISRKLEWELRVTSGSYYLIMTSNWRILLSSLIWQTRRYAVLVFIDVMQSRKTHHMVKFHQL